MRAELPVLTVADAEGWARWLDEHDGQGDGIWLTLAKKGTTEPTRLTYEDALAEAICHGWIDGQLAKGDAGTFRRKFTQDLAGTLADDRAANAMFDRLSAANRFAVLYRVTTAKRADTRRRRIEQFVAMLARGETIYPQRANRPAGSAHSTKREKGRT